MLGYRTVKMSRTWLHGMKKKHDFNKQLPVTHGQKNAPF